MRLTKLGWPARTAALALVLLAMLAGVSACSSVKPTPTLHAKWGQSIAVGSVTMKIDAPQLEPGAPRGLYDFLVTATNGRTTPLSSFADVFIVYAGGRPQPAPQGVFATPPQKGSPLPTSIGPGQTVTGYFVWQSASGDAIQGVMYLLETGDGRQVALKWGN